MSIEKFEWARCPDGYDFKDADGNIVEASEVTIDRPFTIEPRTVNQESIRPFAADRSVVAEFANIAIAQGHWLTHFLDIFVERYGLPHHPSDPEPVSAIWAASRTIAQMLEWHRDALRAGDQETHDGLYREIVEQFNDARNAWGQVETRLEFVENKPPEWVVLPKTLFHGIWVQFGLLMQDESGHQKCAETGEWYKPKRFNYDAKVNDFKDSKHKDKFNNKLKRRRRLEQRRKEKK
jgi:hypothetical protein